MRMAAAQTALDAENFSANLEACAERAKQAAANGADLIVFPEMFLCGFNYKRNEEFLKNPDFDFETELCAIAKRFNIAVCGTVPFSEDVEKIKPSNRLLYISENGETLCRYDKLHLFGLFNENRHVSAGDEIKVLDTPFGKIGFAICYDLRFPELFTALRKRGADIIVIPSAWPHPRKNHFETLARARAIETQSFVIACNRAGEETLGGKTLKYFGASAIIDPWGEYIAKAKDDAEDLIYADISPSLAEKIRTDIPVIKDRREDLY